MKRIVLVALAALCSVAAWAQSGPIPRSGVTYVLSAPSGSCAASAHIQAVIGPGTLYSCQTGTWAQISGGGGGVTSFFGNTGAITALADPTDIVDAAGNGVLLSSTGIVVGENLGDVCGFDSSVGVKCQDAASDYLQILGGAVTTNVPIHAPGATLTALSDPSGTPTGTPSGTGGTVAASSYNYAQIVAIDSAGNHTTAGTITAAVVTSGSTSRIAWAWTAVTNAVSYQIWGCNTSSCTPGHYYTSSTNSYTQTAPIASGTSGTLPVANTTGALSAGSITATRTIDATKLSGDLPAISGASLTSVNAANVNGASVPASKTIVGTNSSGQIVDASSATLANNTSGTAASLSGTPTQCTGGQFSTGIAANGNANCSTPAGGSVSINPQTVSYVAVLGDAGNIVTMNVAGSNTFTLPQNSSVAFSVGTVIEVIQYGAGQTSVVAGTGVTINTSSSLIARAQWSILFVQKIATNTWVASGDLL